MTQSHSNDDDFAAQLEALRPDLMKHAFWLCRSHPVAEGLVQETFLRAWRSRAQLKDPGALKGWLITICRREHARVFERKQLPTISFEDLPPDGQPLVEDHDVAEMAEVRKAIDELDDRYRVPLLMQVVEGRSTAEIAVHLGLPLPTVLTRLFRARRRLRERLQPIVSRAGQTRRVSGADRAQAAAKNPSGSRSR